MPADLLAGIGALEDVPDFTLDGPWHLVDGFWTVSCSVQISAPSAFVEATTRWTMTVSPSYPGGIVIVTRAPGSGVHGDFAHELVKNIPCLINRGQPLGRWEGEAERSDAYGRLAWFAARLVWWVDRAARGELLLPGDHFGHPLIDYEDKSRSINTLEDEGTLRAWAGHWGQTGEVELRQDHGGHLSTYAVSFSRGGRQIVAPRWGSWVTALPSQQRGTWLLLERRPFLEPWGFPATWGELDGALAAQGVALEPVLQQAFEQTATGSWLLIGYPVPGEIGGSNRRLEWQACQLPPVQRKVNGFRPTAESQWLKVKREALAPQQRVPWVLSSSHQAQDLGSRGFLEENVRTRRFLLIGAGALGSAVAEHLVRTGVTDIAVMDKDALQTGNLVRHTLTLHDVAGNKAMHVARRLQAITTLARPVGHAEAFPPNSVLGRAAVEAADVIIDTTGEDGVVAALGRQRWGTPRVVISLSLGWRAQALYAVAERTTRFNARAYHADISPHVAADLNNKPDDRLPMEGIGCWTPVWPALHTDVQLLAAVGATFVREFVAADDTRRARVYEQITGDEGFGGVRLRAEGE